MAVQLLATAVHLVAFHVWRSGFQCFTWKISQWQWGMQAGPVDVPPVDASITFESLQQILAAVGPSGQPQMMSHQPGHMGPSLQAPAFQPQGGFGGGGFGASDPSLDAGQSHFQLLQGAGGYESADAHRQGQGQAEWGRQPVTQQSSSWSQGWSQAGVYPYQR